MMQAHKIAVMAGDGIGQAVMPEGLRVREKVFTKYDLALEIHHFDWAWAEYYPKHWQMMPDDWQQQLEGFEAVLFGAGGWPEVVPDHISLWESLLKFRRDFDQYINLRPVRLLPGVPSPLATRSEARRVGQATWSRRRAAPTL